jgi:hypothetical protein
VFSFLDYFVAVAIYIYKVDSNTSGMLNPALPKITADSIYSYFNVLLHLSLFFYAIDRIGGSNFTATFKPSRCLTVIQGFCGSLFFFLRLT